MYLLDANVLIAANRDYYPIGRVPEFWEWLVGMGERGNVKVPEEIYEEIIYPRPTQPDALVEWMTAKRDTMVLGETVLQDLVARVAEEGYADNLTDVEIEKIGRDPFLIAYALADIQQRCIVTTEVARPSRIRANRHIPDVSHQFRVSCCDPFKMMRELDFRTDWRNRL